MDTYAEPQTRTDDIADQALEAAENLSEQARGWAEQIGTCAQKRPLTCLLVAIGVGALAGYLLTSRHSRA